MKKIHVYNAKSRLGLVNVPHKQKSPNIGVEEGPDSVMALWKEKNFPIDSYRFSSPEDIDTQDYLHILARESKEMKDMIAKTLQKDEIQIVLGGDHSVSFPSLLALFERMSPDTIGHIQFDSHTDLHLISTSPSGNFHGMWLRPLVDGFDDVSIASLVQTKLSPKNLLFIGNIECEPEEVRFMRQWGVKSITREMLYKNHAMEKIAKFIHVYPHIHINFDIDVFDPSISSATGTPPTHGFFPEEIFPILEILSRHSSISIDVVEVNPRKPKAEKTIALAQRILDTLLS